MKKIKLIIVENDEDEQFFMQQGFEGSGYFEIIAFVKSGEELLHILNNDENEYPELILSDLNMPGKNGYDILRELKADNRFSEIPIVITSTSSIRSVIETCKQLGATEFLQKPDTFVEYEEFAKKLKDTLSNYQLKL